MFEVLSSIGEFIATMGRMVLFAFKGLLNGWYIVQSSVSNVIALTGWLPTFLSACIFAFLIISILRICIELL